MHASDHNKNFQKIKQKNNYAHQSDTIQHKTLKPWLSKEVCFKNKKTKKRKHRSSTLRILTHTERTEKVELKQEIPIIKTILQNKERIVGKIQTKRTFQRRNPRTPKMSWTKVSYQEKKIGSGN